MKLKIAMKSELNLATITLYPPGGTKVRLPNIDFSVTFPDLVAGTYDLGIASNGNAEGAKAKFTFTTDLNSISKSVRAGKSRQVGGFIQFTLGADGRVVP